MSEPAQVLHLVTNRETGETAERCEGCIAKETAIERLTRSYTGTINGQAERIRMLEEAEFAALEQTDPDVESVMRLWEELALDSRWFKRQPECGPGSVRWKDTRRAMRGSRGKQGWEWPPRSMLALRLATRGAFIRAEQQRSDGRFKRDYLDPCTAFFANFDRNHEAATDPAPGLQERARLVLDVPKPLRERWVEVIDMADVCDWPCNHLRFDHHKQEDGTWACGVHGCVCTGFSDQDQRAAEWIREQEERAKKGQLHPEDSYPDQVALAVLKAEGRA